ncbi:MAG: hypothetical protein A3C54_04715 [Deltaproteobacteria bacterium RIFCSPHIGHO2_02_FULL_60_17]|nr:MAG: hypothetical protein A3C54_04715 [Deltaproteobacteria bacterium RIFCSPHIGHO2_02_FULL_60_17]
MDLQKINVKFFAAGSGAVRLTDFIDIFNSWIQSSEGEYYDVADYSHMQAGPGIVLVTHEANIGMDNTGNRLGLLYNRKQPLRASNDEKLEFVFKTALEFCRRIEQEPALKGKIRFQGQEALFLVNDRFLAPNTEETFRAVKPELEGLAEILYGGTEFTLDYNGGVKQRFSVSIKAPRAFEINTLLKNLGSGGDRLIRIGAE